MSVRTLLAKTANRPTGHMSSTFVPLLKKLERHFPSMSAVAAFPTSTGASTMAPACSTSPSTVAVPTPTPPPLPLTLLPPSPAAPTRGDRSLGYQLATEGVAHVLALDDADWCRQRKENHGALAWKPSGLASYYSYGALMQMAEATPRYNACFKRTFQMF
jgi:hypothetical protein